MQDVLRDAMDAGAAGFATSFAFPHRGHRRQAGSQPLRRPRRAGGAARHDGRGRSRCRVDRTGRPVPTGRHVRPADQSRGAVHVGCAAHVARPRPPAGPGREPRRLGTRRRGVAAGDAAPAHLRVHPRLAVPARGQRALRRAPERLGRRARPRVRRPRLARADDAGLERRRRTSVCAGTPTRSGRARCTPSWSIAGWPTSPPSGASSRSTACSTSRSRNPASSCACGPSSPTTTRPAWPISWSTSTARWGSRMPERTRASSATRRRRPTSSATGCATRASCRWNRRSAS